MTPTDRAIDLFMRPGKLNRKQLRESFHFVETSSWQQGCLDVCRPSPAQLIRSNAANETVLHFLISKSLITNDRTTLSRWPHFSYLIAREYANG